MRLKRNRISLMNTFRCQNTINDGKKPSHAAAEDGCWRARSIGVLTSLITLRVVEIDPFIHELQSLLLGRPRQRMVNQHLYPRPLHKLPERLVRFSFKMLL